MPLNYDQNITALLESERWLKRSYDNCAPLLEQESYSDSEFDALEALSSRYARTVDIIIQKVFRSIDYVELEETGSIIDTINRANKRELVDDIDKARQLKDLRNEIAHEYITEEILKLYNEIIKNTPMVFEITSRIIVYCKEHKYLSNSRDDKML